MGFKPPTGEEEALLQRHVADMAKAAAHTGKARFSGFLNERECALATAALQRERFERYRFSGGYLGAERCMLCVFEGEAPPAFPITPLDVLPGAGAALTHRDFLGAILALGLSRSCIGDILVSASQTARVYVQDGVAPLLLQELTSVGRVAVKVRPGAQESGKVAPGGEMLRINVASLRLDAVLAAVLHTSRTVAAGLVERGDVQVNHLQAQKPHTALEAGDVLSVRGKGKFRLEALGGKSRKDRTFVEMFKY